MSYASLTRHAPSSVDTVVDVGGQHFVAHRHVLAEHSGYFRGMLMVDGPVSQTLDGGVLRPTFRTTTVSPSLVSPRTFAVLLDYMYSSRLRLDTDIGGGSVPDVLRSAQLLDMPKVVDVCRQYVQNVLHANVDYAQRPPPPPPLSMRIWPTMFVDHQEQQQQQQHQLASSSMIFPSTSASSRVIRPIASRRPLPSQHSYHHQNYCHEFMSSNTMMTASSIERPEQKQVTTGSTAASLLPVSSSQQPQLPPQPDQDVQRPVSAATSSSSATGSWISVVSDGDNGRKEKSEEVDETKTKEEKESVMVDASSSQQQQPSLQKVVVDIAYCDGPVKFQRILNENCDLVMFLQTTIVQCQKHRSVRSSKDKQQQQQQQHREKQRPASAQNDTNAGPAAGARKRKRRREMRPEEGDEDDEQDGDGEEEEPNGNSATFCVHCKHTFKSRYCYMKHMRRHLNPLTVHECDTACPTKPTSKNTDKPNTSAELVSHVDSGTAGNQSSDDRASKLLEINSTFYPCKLCGSKFPSYYFLHKHQRIFHADHAPSATDDEKTSQSADDCERAAPTQEPKSSLHV